MSVEKVAAGVAPSTTPAMVVFYYDTEKIFNSVSLRSTYRAKMVKDQAGVSQLDDIAISEDERDLVLEYYEQAIYDVFGRLFKMTGTVTDPIFFNDIYVPTTGATLEIALNPTFLGSAANWTLGSGWAYSNNTIVATAASANAIQAVEPTFISGRTYKVTTIIIAASAGTVAAKIGAVVGASHGTTGTFVEYLVAGASGALACGLYGTAFTGVVDSCRIELVGEELYSGGKIADNAAYNENILLNIDKKIENCIRYYILSEWWISCSMGDDAKLNWDRYKDYLRQIENLTLSLRKPLMS